MVASVPGIVGQDNEQIYEIERRGWLWRTTGRVASDVEVEAWMDRIANLQWSDSEDCTGIKSAVLGVYRGGDNLGWAEHRHAWSGVSVHGRHFTNWPFDDDHWIIIQPARGSRTDADVIETLIHEALHHVMGQDHTKALYDGVDCAVIDSGW